MAGLTRPARRRLAAAGGIVAVGVLGALLWHSPEPSQVPPTRAREYTSFDACLLTGAAGITSTAAAPVWSGMREASATTSARISYLAATGPDTTANVTTFLNSLLARRCELILAAGATEVAAVHSRAAAAPGTRFVVVGAGAAGTMPGNVTSIAAAPPDRVTAAVRDAVTEASNHSGASPQH